MHTNFNLYRDWRHYDVIGSRIQSGKDRRSLRGLMRTWTNIYVYIITHIAHINVRVSTSVMKIFGHTIGSPESVNMAKRVYGCGNGSAGCSLTTGNVR